MKKSLLVTQISNCDYPLYRQWLEKYHLWFDEIIIYFDISFRFPIFSSFIQSSLSHLPDMEFIDPIEFDRETRDWRDTSTNEMLKHATGDWVISIEQDWFTKDWDRLLETSEKMMNQFDLFGWWNETNSPYIHPAFWFMKREALEKTSKDFSPHPEINGADHFSTITQEALKNGLKVGKIQDFGYETNVLTPEKTDAFHLGGVNQNFLNGLTDGYNFHRGELFNIYNYETLKVKPLHPIYEEMVQKLAVKLNGMYPEVDKNWEQFFKI